MIKVQKIKITGILEVDVDCSDVKELEEYRKSVVESYQKEGQPPFDISFTIQSENFTDIQYPKQKKKP